MSPEIILRSRFTGLLSSIRSSRKWRAGGRNRCLGISGVQGMNGSVQAKSIQVLPSHELVSTRIAEHLGDSQSLGRMLADRARGGRIQQKNSDPFVTQGGVLCTSSGKSGSRTEGDEEKGLITSDAVWSTKVSKTAFVLVYIYDGWKISGCGKVKKSNMTACMQIY